MLSLNREYFNADIKEEGEHDVTIKLAEGV